MAEKSALDPNVQEGEGIFKTAVHDYCVMKSMEVEVAESQIIDYTGKKIKIKETQRTRYSARTEKKKGK
jgi:hypothetical protein